MSSNTGKLCRDLIGGTLSIKNTRVLDSVPNLTVKGVKCDDMSAKQMSMRPVLQKGACPCLSLSAIATEPIAQGRILKVSASTDFGVEEITPNDSNFTGIIGVSTSSASYEEAVRFCVLGAFEVEIEANAAVSCGQNLTRSTVEYGTAHPVENGAGTFAIALESAEPSPAAIPWTASSDFDQEILTFPSVLNVSSLCLNSSQAYCHSHGDPVDVAIRLWNETQWVEVWSRTLESDEEFYFNSLGKITIPTIASVSKIQFWSNPGQDQTFHNMDTLFSKFNCLTIKACFNRNEENVDDIGDIKHSAKEADHNGWLLCDGRSLNETEYPLLFQAIGTSFGTLGPGTFSLPDGRGRVLGGIGAGTGLTPRALGTSVGSETVILSGNELPPHTHTGTTNSDGSHSHTSNAVGGQGNYGLALANGGGTIPTGTDSTLGELNIATVPQALTINAAGTHTHAFTTDSTGLGQPLSLMQPTLFIGNVFIFAGR